MQNDPKNTLTTDDLRLLLENAINIDDEMTYKQTVNHVLYCLFDMVQELQQKDSPKPMVHGVNCPKVVHRKTLKSHAVDDDGPYDKDDGATYCGRCHVKL